MALRFFFDECADEDVATVSDLVRKGLSDPEQLNYARQEGRVVYTTDDDFLRLAADCLRRGEFFPGVIYHAVGARSKRQIIDALVLCDGVFEPADMHNHIEFI